MAYRIAYQHPAQRRRQLRRKIPHLVGVRKNRQVGIRFRHKLAHRRDISVRRVRLKQIVLHRARFRQLFPRQLRGQAGDTLANHRGFHRLSQFFADLLRRRHRLPRHAVPRAAPLLSDHQDAHSTRASNFNFSTSFAAASLGLPSKICACLARPGA